VKLNFESFQERAKAQRKVRAAEAERQKEEKPKGRKKCVEAEKARLEEIKEEEVEKAHMEQSREATDQKVDGLLANGLAEELTKKGKAHNKRLKTLLENMLRHPISLRENKTRSHHHVISFLLVRSHGCRT
jgi:hypothetical protein